MMELKDPGIKLFGKKIALTENGENPVVSGQDSGLNLLHKDGLSDYASITCLEDDKVNGIEEEDGQVAEKDYVEGQSETKTQNKAPTPVTEDSKESPDSNGSPKTPSLDEETATLKPSETENDRSDTNNAQQKTLKKPDKILPCPRCNSMDTKFCYYNNYNVNQPRHFCKSCQRYWTSGGTMRNVPVGAGRRKNKNSDSNYRLITMSEALHAAQIDALNGIHNPTLKNNGTVLSFGTDSPLCKSMSCVLNLAEKNVPNSTPNGFYKQRISVSCKGGEYGDDCSSGSSITSSNSNMKGRKGGIKEPEVHNIHGFPPQVPFLPGVPWPCPWNPAVPVQAICSSGFPFPQYPTPYWNCNVPGSWSIPWLPPPSSTTNQKAPGYGPKSPILGKHSREGDLLKPSKVEEEEHLDQNNSERPVLVPKTLRIDDLDEAAKSSIWASLGIKNDSISKEGVFKAFQQKKDEKGQVIRPSPVLHANPAALSRSLSFQERA